MSSILDTSFSATKARFGFTLSRRSLLIFSAAIAVGSTITACSSVGSSYQKHEEKLTAQIFLEPGERPVLPKGKKPRKVYEKGLKLTKVSEGFVPTLYNDAAQYCTIGYGHLIDKNKNPRYCNGSEPEEFLRGITESRGGELLKGDMGLAELAVMTSVKTELTDGQYAALCDFVYNVGGGNFRKSTLSQVVNRREFDRVPTQFRRWTMAGGKKWPGLQKRREREIELFFDGLAIPRAVPRFGEIVSPIDITKGE
jgi:lysozyme